MRHGHEWEREWISKFNVSRVFFFFSSILKWCVSMFAAMRNLIRIIPEKNSSTVALFENEMKIYTQNYKLEENKFNTATLYTNVLKPFRFFMTEKREKRKNKKRRK